MERVTVIIPTYNRERTIVRALNSVLNQTYDKYSIIVVDDCSTDNTKKVVEDLKSDKITYYRLEENLGAGGARNYGVAQANTDYIAFHDSDDEWMSDKLEKQMKYMVMHPEIGMVYSKMHIITNKNEGDYPNETVEGDLEGDLHTWLLRRNTIGAPTMLIKKKNFEAIGGFDDKLRCLEDWEFAVRFSKMEKIGYLDDPLVLVHSEYGGVSSNRAGYYEARCKMIADYKNEMIECGIFDRAVLEMFKRAEMSGVLEYVQKLLMVYLNRG